MLKRSPWPVILQIVPELSTGGAERTTLEMAEAITMAGGRALVLSQGGRLEKELGQLGGELIRFPAHTKNPISIIRNGMRIAKIIEEHNVTLVHARSRAPAWSAMMAARRTKRPFVTTYHGIYNQKSRAKSLYNSVMVRGDAVICNSRYTASVVMARHPEASARLVVIPRGVDLESFNGDMIAPERLFALRHQWGIMEMPRVVLVPARLTRWKGQQVVIDAVSKLDKKADLADVVFVFAGDAQGRTPYKAELEDAIKQRGLQAQFRIVGHCDDMPAAFKLADFSIIPSIEAEAFGRVSIEAQAMGSVVIASNIGALPETVAATVSVTEKQACGAVAHEDRHVLSQSKHPWLFEPGNAEALANLLKIVLKLAPDDLQSVRDEAMTRIRAKFSKQALQQHTLQVYDQLMGTQMVQSFRLEMTNRGQRER